VKNENSQKLINSHHFMASGILLPPEQTTKGYKKALKILAIVWFFTLLGINNPALSTLNGISCCGMLLMILLISSGNSKYKKQMARYKVQLARVQQQQVLNAQPVQQQVIHHHHHAPQAQQQQQVQRPSQLTPEFKLNYAMNLEKARNFEKAAEAYFELGMFEESARIRQTYLEKDTGTTVNIGKVGDTHINDSVVMNEPTSSMQPTRCRSCQQPVEPEWTMCPHCTQPL
jgi:hypothetical protein